MGNLDRYAKALKRGRSGLRFKPRSPAGTVERPSPGGQPVAAEPVDAAGGTSGAGAQPSSGILARLRRILGAVELVEDSPVNTVNRVNRGKP